MKETGIKEAGTNAVDRNAAASPVRRSPEQDAFLALEQARVQEQQRNAPLSERLDDPAATLQAFQAAAKLTGDLAKISPELGRVAELTGRVGLMDNGRVLLLIPEPSGPRHWVFFDGPVLSVTDSLLKRQKWAPFTSLSMLEGQALPTLEKVTVLPYRACLNDGFGEIERQEHRREAVTDIVVMTATVLLFVLALFFTGFAFASATVLLGVLKLVGAALLFFSSYRCVKVVDLTFGWREERILRRSLALVSGASPLPDSPAGVQDPSGERAANGLPRAF